MHKKTWTIRKANLSDTEGLSKCMRAAYGVYRSRFMDKLLPPMTVDYANEIRTYPVWVAESEGNVVGGLILMSEENWMTIANVAVHPQFQGNGLGRGLIAFAEAQAKQQSYSELRLATHVALTENVSLYAYLGWSETGREEYRVYMQKKIV